MSYSFQNYANFRRHLHWKKAKNVCSYVINKTAATVLRNVLKKVQWFGLTIGWFIVDGSWLVICNSLYYHTIWLDTKTGIKINMLFFIRKTKTGWPERTESVFQKPTSLKRNKLFSWWLQTSENIVYTRLWYIKR